MEEDKENALIIDGGTLAHILTNATATDKTFSFKTSKFYLSSANFCFPWTFYKVQGEPSITFY